ncbi:MAG: 1-deoxy-D-xylulose-5-phosphate synthase, partial [Planctomycetota bacterium]
MTTHMLADLLTPADLRSFDDQQLEALAEEIRHRIRTTVTATGGHLSSNLGVVELTLALHRTFDFLSDRLLWDVGHQANVHKLLTGRQGRFHTIRTKGGL